MCLAQGQVRDRYRSISIVVRYMRDGVGEVIVQVEYQCTDGVWSFGDASSITTSPVATLSTPVKYTCILCIHPSKATFTSISAAEHCIG